MRNTAENRGFPQPWLKNPLEAGQKTEPWHAPPGIATAPRTGVSQPARSMRRRPPLCPLLPRRRVRSRTQATLQITPRPNADRRQDRSQRIGSKIPRLLLCPCPKRLREPTVFLVRRPLHDATLIYGQVDMTREGPPLPGTSAPVNAVRRVPCFRPFSCIDIDTRNVYDYILNFVEQFQHITRQICSPIAARP